MIGHLVSLAVQSVTRPLIAALAAWDDLAMSCDDRTRP